MKKLFSFLIAAAMILNLVPVAYAATPKATVSAIKSGNTVVVTVTLPPVTKLTQCLVSVQFNPSVVSFPREVDTNYAATRLVEGEQIPYFIGEHAGGYKINTKNIVLNAFMCTDGVTKKEATPFARFVFTIKDKNVEKTSFKVKVEQYVDASTTPNEISFDLAEKFVVLQMPSAPASVKAAAASYNSVKVSWKAASDATGYIVYWLNAKGTYVELGKTTSASLTHKSLTIGKKYYYKVKAYKTFNGKTYYSGYSSVVSAAPMPTAPANLKASVSYNSIKLTWSAVSGATGYQVYYATSQTGKYTKLATNNSKTLTFTHKSLTTGKTYYYKVRSYKTVGGKNYYSSYSAAAVKPLPAVPGAVKAASASYNSVKISWNAVSGATKYVVYYCTSQSGTYKELARTTSTGYTHTKLTTGKTYYYKVRAYRTVNKTNYYGNYSAAVKGRPVPSAPASFAAAKASSTSVKVSWKAVSGASAYQVYRATSASGTYTLVKTTTSTSFTNTGLAKGKTYYFKVRAYNKTGSTVTNGSYTAVKSIKL